MSEFASEGFAPFPNLHSDVKSVEAVAEWTDAAIEYKTDQYGQFLERDDIMPRAVNTANWILDRLIFELAYRDGVYTPQGTEAYGET